MDDAALARRLAIEKLETKAAELRSCWAWTKAGLDPEYGFIAQYGRVRPKPVEPTAEIAQAARDGAAAWLPPLPRPRRPPAR
jgi:hypothetical protein